MNTLRVIDSHTGGEPTRVVLEGGPDLGSGDVAGQLAVFLRDHDALRQGIVLEPRGSDVLVGAMMCQPSDPRASHGVFFFNNVGGLGMCGHGLIGVVVTLAHLGRLTPGPVVFETPVGLVEASWDGAHEVSLQNVPSWRKATGVVIEVPGHGPVTGDVAWAGNWFYLVKDHGQALLPERVEKLTDLSWRIRQAVNAGGFPEVDHVELFGPGQDGGDSRNFVLCPGKAFDRSPCGTGTSAKLACLAADGHLAEGAEWVQESIIGSRFTGSFRWHDQASGSIVPTVKGSAFVMAESTLVFHPDDPFRHGIAL